MSVDSSISIRMVKSELKACSDYAKKCGWLISDANESNLSFTVNMTSPIDNETYILSVIFSDYPELPLILDFIDPTTDELGSRNAFPNSDDSFFHKRNPPFICSPCSRKAYTDFKGVKGPHSDWKMIGWRTNQKTGGLVDVVRILQTIYSRISNEKKYNGRMP